MEAKVITYELKLRYPFGISRGTVTELPTVLLNLGGRGIGEGSPVRYKKQSADQAVPLLEEMARGVTPENIDDLTLHEERARQIAPDHSAARCAFDIALWDARAKAAGVPLYEAMGAKRPVGIQTSYTVSLSDHDTMEQRAREAAHLPLIKVKLGRSVDFDLEAMRRIRAAAPDTLLRIDANAGWTLGDARTIVPKLADMGVDLIEQPLAIGNIDGMRQLAAETPLAVIADEDAQDMKSLPELVGAVDGINIKLMKCGGLSEALRMIRFARDQDWKILVGCMIETRCALGAGAHLGGLVDYLDLDAYMLTTNDPFPGGSLEKLTAEPPLAEGPGLGLAWPSELAG